MAAVDTARPVRHRDVQVRSVRREASRHTQYLKRTGHRRFGGFACVAEPRFREATDASNDESGVYGLIPDSIFQSAPEVCTRRKPDR